MFAPPSAEAFLIVYTACLAIQDERSRMILHFYFYLGCAEAVARIIPFAFFGSRLGYPFFCSFSYVMSIGSLYLRREMVVTFQKSSEPFAKAAWRWVVYGGDPQMAMIEEG
jgi:hypothetical protein